MKVKATAVDMGGTGSQSRRPLAMPLEPRMMFDGAAVLTAAATLSQVEAQTAPDSAPPSDADLPAELPSSVALPQIWRAAQADLTGGRREAVFISEGLPDINTLAAAAAPGAEVWVVSTQGDGIAQLAAWAAGRSGYDAIHLVGYGAPGAQMVGGTALDTDALTQRANELRALGASLTPNGDILLYGCNITATDNGVTFLRSLSELTGADVAASDDITGSATAGGNWTLESVVGSLESATLQPVGWEGSLHTNSVGFNIVNNNGTLTLYFFYGSWHNGAINPEGALSLYTLRSGGNRDNYADYTVEAYGVDGALGNQTYLFQSPTSGSTETVGGITLSYENGSNVYTNALIDASGFVRGSTYYWADTSNLYSDNAVGGGSVYNHQWAQITGIQAGTYTAYYDNNPVGALPPSSLSATWSPQTAIRQMIFTITASGQVVLGSSTPVTKTGAEDTVLSFTDSDFTGNFSGTLGDIKIVSLPGKGTLFVDADGDNALDSGEAAAVNQQLTAADRGNLRFAPNANINGSTSFQWLAYDQGNSRWASSNSDVSITITAANDAPTASGTATLAAVGEDTVSPAGSTVSTLFASNFSDATDQVAGGSSANTLAGAVIVANTADASTQGAWQYTTDNGTTWHNVGTVSSSSGLILAHTAKLRFVPVADYNGSPAGLTAHLVDSSYSGSYTLGSTRASVDMAGAGGTSAYSTGTSSLGTSITAVDDPASIALGASPGGSYTENATDKFVAPNLTLSDIDAFVLDSAKLMISSNFSASQDRLVLTANAATMGNITGSYNTSTGVMTLSSSGGTATMAQWQEALRNVRYQNLSDDPSTATRTIDITLGNAIKLTIGGVDHYYEYVSGNLTWDAAYAAAQNRTFMGMTGYLVTITSAEENAFIKDKLAGNAWMGASDATQTWTVNGTTFTTSEGNWTWVAGPEAGQKFWQDDTNAGNSIEYFQGSPVGGLYSNWDSGEPNNWGGTEDVAHFYASNGKWNDFAANNTGAIAGYVVEYSGSGASSSVTSVSTTITPVRVNDAPSLPAITQPTTVNEAANAAAQDLNITGTFNVTDPDAGDTLTPTVVGSPVVRLNGAVITSGFPAALVAAGAFSVSPSTRTSTGSAASFTWTYDPAAANLDYLKATDTLTITYQVKVGDGVLESSTRDVAITLQGTNDAPVVTDTTDPAAVDETDDAAAQDLAPLSGSFALVDRDLGNTLSASVGSPVVALNGATITTGFPAALTAAGAFSITPASQTSAAGSATAITWTYDPGPADLDFLLAGDTLTVTYAVTVTDGTSPQTQNVTFTLRGTNEKPVASGVLEAMSLLQGQRVERSFAALFSDEDDSSRTYGVQGLPPGLSLDATTGVISGAPTRPGTYSITLQAIDPSGAVGTTTWQLRVNAPAQAPVAPPPDPAAPRGTGPGGAGGTERPGTGGLRTPGATPGGPAPLPGEVAIQGFGTSIPLMPGAGPAPVPPGMPANAPTAGPAPTPAATVTANPVGAAPVIVLPGIGPVSAVNPGGGLVIGSFAAPTPRGDGVPAPVVDRVSLVVGASGQVQVAQTQRAEAAADASGLIVAEVRRVGGGVEVALADTRAQQAAEYSARLPDGQTLPPWVRVDPANGRISTSPPPNVDALNVRVLVRDRDGTNRVMEIRLDFKPTDGAGSNASPAPGAAPADAAGAAGAAGPSGASQAPTAPTTPALPNGPRSDAGAPPVAAAPGPAAAAAPVLPGAGLSSMLEGELMPHEAHSRSLRDALATV